MITLKTVLSHAPCPTPLAPLMGLAVLLAPLCAEAADYCSQLESLGVVGRRVAVTISLGSAHETRGGRVVDIEGGVLTLDPGPDTDAIEPLREGGKIVEPVRTRIYLNCALIVSVTADPTRGSQ